MTERSPGMAVQFGAGNIGRGFIGALLSRAGYRVIFVDVVDALVEAINQRSEYTIKEIIGSAEKATTIENVKAINGKDEAAVVEVIGQATVITTAVGPGILPIIAPVIAKGLERRAQLDLVASLNVIACENLIDNSKILQGHVLSHLASDYRPYVQDHVGFPRCVVDMVVTNPSEAEREANPLLVIAEGQGILIVDRNGFVGAPPDIDDMQLTDNLNAYVEQKIFTLNMAHAVIAYLGYLKGFEFIHQAIQDPEIRQIVSGAIKECSAVLVKKHNLDPAEQKRYADNTLRRFENSTLPDPVVRVAREPKRKLAPNDRLIKPATLALAAGITPTYLATGIAAALLYDAPDDQQAAELSKLLTAEDGIGKVLKEVSGLTPDSALIKLVREKISEVRNLRPV
jgi:mannitol-1-phosphate 5-dehydrogenase